MKVIFKLGISTVLSDSNYEVYRAFGLLDGNGSQILGTPEIDYSIR